MNDPFFGDRPCTDPRRLHPLSPVLALDIDGSIADYYGHFRWFAELYLQRPVTADWSGGVTEFSEALDLDKQVYRDIKLAYRQGGMKRSIPPLDSGVRRLGRALRSQGIAVWICTTRPWQRLDNIDPDTRFWLGNVFGPVDGVIYGEDKYEDLIDIVGKERILGVVDDLPENFEAAERLGLHAILRTGAHNKWYRKQQNNGGHYVPRALDTESIYRATMEWHANYQGETHVPA